jgi:hypothetical protein
LGQTSLASEAAENIPSFFTDLGNFSEPAASNPRKIFQVLLLSLKEILNENLIASGSHGTISCRRVRPLHIRTRKSPINYA